MKTEIFKKLGQQLRLARTSRRLTQPQLAHRIGRNSARISELERDLLNNRMGRDRLTLLADICDALDVEPILVPRAQAGEIRELLDKEAHGRPATNDTRSTFDEVFVDLGDPEDDE